MLYRNLGITLTRKCSASCDICCFCSSPESCECLDEELVKRFVDSSSEVEQIRTIAFTGGEPFLDYELLLRLVKYSLIAGKKSTVITNCYWADNQDNTIERFLELKSAGLVRVNLSYDRWHSEFISPENVRRVLRACNQVGIPVQIGMVVLKDEKVGSLIDKLEEDGLNATFQTVPCLPVGGAKANIKNEKFIRKKITPPLPCMYDGNLVVSYDGKIYPCCSQMVIDTALEVGDYRSDTAPDILKRIKNNGFLYLLRNRGVDFFVDEAKRNGIEIPDEIVNQCELCSILFSKENIRSFLPFVKRELCQYA